VPPQDQFFEQEEKQEAGENRQHHTLGRAVLEGVRQQFQEYRAEQRADGKAD
jgi:ATP-dependent RNA circularization protein (DNA/RNA ligase family)